MKKYILNDNKKILFLKNNEILIDGKNAYRIKLTETDYNNLTEICKKYMIFSKECVSSKLFNKLYSNKIIVEANKNIVESYQNRNERNELFAFNFFSNNTFKKLYDKKILFVGVGGIASIIIDQLISVGIYKFSIIDFDKVDISNLNRQFVYREKDVGLKKTDLFEQYILSKNKNAVIKKYDLMLETSSQLETIIKKDDIDFMINSADMPPYCLQKNIVESSIKLNVPCIFGGVGITEGSYGPLLTNKSCKIKYLKNINNILSKVNYFFPCKSSFGVTNSIISTYMSWDIIMYLLGEKKYVKSLNKEIFVNFKETKL